MLALALVVCPRQPVRRLDLASDAGILGRGQDARCRDQQPGEPALPIQPLPCRARGRLGTWIRMGNRLVDGDTAGMIEDVLAVVGANRFPTRACVLPITIA